MNLLLALFSIVYLQASWEPSSIPIEGMSIVVTSDSLQLHTRYDYSTEAIPLFLSYPRGERLYVVQVERDASDTTQTWVQLAHDSNQVGWMKWRDFLSNTAPNNPISRLLHALLSTTGKILTAIIALAALCLCFTMRRRDWAIYFALASAALFLMIIFFMLCFWSNDTQLYTYYLSPSLSPIADNLSTPLRILILLFWTNIVLWLAALFSLRRRTAV